MTAPEVSRPHARWTSVLAKLALSVALLAGLVVFVGEDQFWRLGARLQWRYLVDFCVALTLLVVAFAYRWRLLLDGGCAFPCALSSTILGLGGNQVLPARGGDLIRAIYCVRQGSVSFHKSISALVLEKILDLLMVALIGLGAFSFFSLQSDESAVKLTALATSVVIVAGALCVFWLAHRNALAGTAKYLCRLGRVGPLMYRHIYRALFEFSRATQAHRVGSPSLVTGVMWFGLYAYAYVTVAAAVDIRLDYYEALVLVFVGALGLAIPAAPSGVGTFHASIVSGFLLIDRSASEGLALAVALHGLFFVSYVVPSVILYAYQQVARHHRS